MRPLYERFWVMVDKAGPAPPHQPHLGPCWLWTGKRLANGYGTVRSEKKSLLAHRAAFALAHGRPPRDCCLHRCDNRRCVRPDHLFEGTIADNNVDMFRKGRGKNPRHYMYGAKNPASKLSLEQVREIRALRANGLSQLAIAKRLGVSQTQVGNILSGKHWSNAA